MGIIEKLGMKRIDPVRYTDDETPWVAYNPKDIEELEQQNREMLEALIISIKHDHKYFDGLLGDWNIDNLKKKVFTRLGRQKKSLEIYNDFIRSLEAIETVCHPLKWPQIKELI